MPAPPTPLLSIQDLSVAYSDAGSTQTVLRGVSLDIVPGEAVGLVGESGSGKSTLALAVMGYLNPGGRIQSGRIHFRGQDLLSLSPDGMRAVWGSRIAFVPQDPFSSLNPSMRIRDQLAECLRLHAEISRPLLEDRLVELLEMVRLSDVHRVLRSYPHQISGGMRQRVLIAMALSAGPDLLILDEPTTGLDVTTEASILDLVRDLIRARDTAALYVTHNLGVVAGLCDRVAVMYAGELVEIAPTHDIFAAPLNPYTRGLLDSVPRMGQYKHEFPLRAIPGAIPAPHQIPAGCTFAPRCPLVIDRCRAQHPALDRVGVARQVRCHRWPEIESGLVSARRLDLAPPRQPAAGGEQVLSAERVSVDYPRRWSLSDLRPGASARSFRALDAVSLELHRAQTLGIVGESGSGKTSLARAAAGLLEAVSGRFHLLGSSLPSRLPHRDRETLARLQMIFQDPGEALNPFLSVGESLRRPLLRLAGLSPAQADARVAELLAAVRLPEEYALRTPGQLSGGELQRVSLARAFAALPDLILADEPVSSLDVSVQASILNLLLELQSRHDTALLFISHDIGVVAYLADRIAVMYLGQLMELTPAQLLFTPPYHPYTEALLSAVPVPDPTTRQERIRLPGDGPERLVGAAGCPFRSRCPRLLGDICRDQTPPWQESRAGKRIFCHIPPEELSSAQQRVIVWRDA